MGYFGRKFDKMSQHWSRSFAIAYILIFSVDLSLFGYGAVANLMSGKSPRVIDSVWCILSALNIFIGIGTLRAINRRQAAERSIAP
jgi:hypothetical protein